MDDYNQYGGGPEGQYGGVPEQDLTGQILYQGSIHNTNLTDLFFLIIHEQKVGVLEVWDGEYRKRVHFRPSGVSVTSIAPARSVLLIGSQLVEIGRISNEQLEEALTEQQTSHKLLGEIFVEKELTTVEEVMALLRRQIKQDIFEIFFWPNLEYAFYEGDSLYETPHVDARLVGMTFDTSKYVVDLANVLGYFITLEHPGTLFIQSENRQTDLHFNGSMIEFSNYREEKQIRLGELLIQKGWLTQEGLDQGLADQQASEEGGLLGEILVFRGYISDEHLAEALKEQMAIEFVAAFQDENVTYTYLAGGPPLDSESRVSTVNIPLDLRRLVMESFIVVDEWEQFISMIPNSIGVFPYDEAGNIDTQNLNMDDIAAQLHSQINRSFNIEEISQMLGISQFDTAILLSHFVRNVLLQSAEAFQKVGQAGAAANDRTLAVNALNQARVYMPWDIAFLEELVEQHKQAGNKQEAAAYLYELAFLKSDETNFVQNIDAVLKIDPNHFEARQYMFDFYLTNKPSGQADERAGVHADHLFGYYQKQKQYDEARKVAHLCQEKSLDPLTFAQKTVDMYSMLNMQKELAVELQRLADLQKNLKRFESEFQTLQQLRDLSSDKIEIDNRIKVLRKMGIGPPEKKPVMLYTVSVVGVIFLLIVGFIIFRSTSKESKFDQAGERHKHLASGEILFNTQTAEAAIKWLKPLAEYGGGYPEEKDAKELISKYTKAEKKRKSFWAQYRKDNEEEKWSEAARILDELKDIHTPKDRRVQQDEIADEEAEIEPHIKELRATLASWNAQLEAFKQKIHNYYRKKTQDPLNLLRVEENITTINNITIPKIIDSERVRQDLKDAKDFAQDMKNNVIKRRYDIFEGSKKSENSKRDLQLKCLKYRSEIENLGKLQKKGDLIKRANEYVTRGRDGFVEKFSKFINENDPATCEEPIAELYGLNFLLADLDSFIDLIKNPPADTTLNLLSSSPFLPRLEKLRKKVKDDFDSLYGQSYKNELTNFEIKYSYALEQMKKMAQELIDSGDLKPIKPK